MKAEARARNRGEMFANPSQIAYTSSVFIECERLMRILLIQPGISVNRFARPFGAVEPLGLESLAATLRPIADVDFIDMRFSSTRELERRIADDNIQACGISSTFTMDYRPAIQLAEAIKRIDPRIFVFVGGHHPSLRPVDFLLPWIDAIVVGEGERTILDIFRCIGAKGELDRVEGLALNTPSGQILTPPRCLVEKLDSLPPPERSVVKAYRKFYRLFTERDVTAIETSRGCPFRCNFCSVWVFYRGKVRMKSPDAVVREIESTETGEVFFVDDNFFSSVSRAARIATLLSDRGIKKRYLLQTRTDVVARNPRLLEVWAKIGLLGVFLGIEKVAQDDLDSIDKKNTVENNGLALDILRALNITAVTSFIANTDADMKDFALLREYVRKKKLRMPLFTVLTPLPGTKLFEDSLSGMTFFDYDKFDLFHPVVPTKLEVGLFLKEFASLYRTAYPAHVALIGGVAIFLEVIRGKLSLSDWLEIVTDWKRLTNPRFYLSLSRQAEMDYLRLAADSAP